MTLPSCILLCKTTRRRLRPVPQDDTTRAKTAALVTPLAPAKPEPANANLGESPGLRVGLANVDPAYVEVAEATVAPTPPAEALRMAVVPVDVVETKVA